MAFVQPTDCFSYKGVVYDRGTIVDSDDEVAKRYPTLFASLDGDAPVERATSRPGEKRATRRPKKDATKAD